MAITEDWIDISSSVFIVLLLGNKGITSLLCAGNRHAHTVTISSVLQPLNTIIINSVQWWADASILILLSNHAPACYLKKSPFSPSPGDLQQKGPSKTIFSTTVMIRFSALLPMSAPLKLFFCQWAPLLSKHLYSNKRPFSNTRPYSVPVKALINLLRYQKWISTPGAKLNNFRTQII